MGELHAHTHSRTQRLWLCSWSGGGEGGGVGWGGLHKSGLWSTSSVIVQVTIKIEILNISENFL